MATAESTEGGDDFQIRPVNSHATVSVGRSEHGNYYEVRDMSGDIIKERAQVAGQGTLYIGNAYANAQVRIKKVSEADPA